jgi:hypothetical protein
MDILDVGKLLVGTILVVSGIYLLRQHKKAAGDEEQLRVIRKATTYVAAATLLLIFFVHHLGVVGTFIGSILASILVVTVILAVADVSRWTRLDDWLWHDGPQTPGYSKSKMPVPYIRWARRAAMVQFTLFALIMAAVALLGGSPAPASATAQGNGSTATAAPTAPATAPATTAPTAAATASATSIPTTAPTTSDSASAQKFVDNNCTGPKQIPVVDNPSTIQFGTGNMMICYNGKWQKWSDFATTSAPSSVTLKAWVVDGSYGYGQVVDPNTGDPYIIQTTDF